MKQFVVAIGDQKTGKEQYKEGKENAKLHSEEPYGWKKLKTRQDDSYISNV